MAAGREVRCVAGLQSAIKSVALSPDGRRVACGLVNGTVLIWNSGVRNPAAAKGLAEEELHCLWNELTGDSADLAYNAAAGLAAHPEQAVAFLRAQVQPAISPDGKQVAAWLEALDSDDFAEREAATRELAAVRDLVEGPILDILHRKPTLDLRRRLESILKAKPTLLPPESLHRRRAVVVLEWIGSAAARQVLARLAAGADFAPETIAARAALGRLEQQLAGKR
jgi:hypothetical protein